MEWQVKVSPVALDYSRHPLLSTRDPEVFYILSPSSSLHQFTGKDQFKKPT